MGQPIGSCDKPRTELELLPWIIFKLIFLSLKYKQYIQTITAHTMSYLEDAELFCLPNMLITPRATTTLSYFEPTLNHCEWSSPPRCHPAVISFQKVSFPFQITRLTPAHHITSLSHELFDWSVFHIQTVNQSVLELCSACNHRCQVSITLVNNIHHPVTPVTNL